MDHNTSALMQRDLFGLSVDALTMAQALGRCTDAIETDQRLSIGVVNAAKIVAMQRNAQLREAVAECDMVLADGQAVVWASRVLGSPLPERVAGIDLFMELLGESARRGYRVYFLGARPSVLAKMMDEVSRRFPELTVAGARDGYYQAGEEAKVAADISRSRADILFVGMSSPRKEVFLSEWGTATQARVVHGVGGSFDVLAGLTRRAPAWWQDHGLEWLYRALQEPVRLGRRYLTTNMSFIVLVARERMRRRPRPGGIPAGDRLAGDVPAGSGLSALVPSAERVTPGETS
jgi:N-acetylglucosaminyldiphosphoundecaprenol N-acetyl-beta-D-mannosaminyltransferase